MSTRRYRCCKCCEGTALDDHVGHGGGIEKDDHDGPCNLPGCQEFGAPHTPAPVPTAAPETEGPQATEVQADLASGGAAHVSQPPHPTPAPVPAAAGEDTEGLDWLTQEFAVVITALMAGKIDGPQAVSAATALVQRVRDEGAGT